MMTSNEKIALCEKAIQASKNSYSPYSGFKVGAALLCEDGSVFLGCNIENASYSATNCAERVAVQTAVASGNTKFKAIAIAGGKGSVGASLCSPCGACRQVLAEFCHPDSFLVLLAHNGGYKEFTLSQLLPHGFTKENL